MADHNSVFEMVLNTIIKYSKQFKMTLVNFLQFKFYIINFILIWKNLELEFSASFITKSYK